MIEEAEESQQILFLHFQNCKSDSKEFEREEEEEDTEEEDTEEEEDKEEESKEVEGKVKNSWK